MGYAFSIIIAIVVTLVGLVALLIGFDPHVRAASIPGAILFVGGMILLVLVDIREILWVHTRRMKAGSK